MLVGLQPLNGSIAGKHRPGSRQAKNGNCNEARSLASQHQRDSEDLPRVYVATLPLVGWEVVESTLRDAYPDQLALHSVIGIEQDSAFTVFDFLPSQPKSPLTAAKLLTGGSVKGLLRERQLHKRMTRRCWLIGISRHTQVCPSTVHLSAWCVLCFGLTTIHDSEECLQAVQAARSFNAAFPSDLRLFDNDCWTHSEALARHLVGDHIDVKWQKSTANIKQETASRLVQYT
jgi:hypothetical protein